MIRRRPGTLPRYPRSRLWIYITAIAVLWSVVVAVSLISNLRQQRQETLEVAREAARTAHERDVIYRRWNAQHGGVYVPVTEETQPNPYLASLTDRPIEVRAYPGDTQASSDPGLILTLVNPAYMTRQVHELSETYHGMQGHITSLDPIRPANAPDDWERAALEAFETGVIEVSEVQTLQGVPAMRLMRPLITEEGCLSCHAIQGYQVGDVRGGISVAVPMATLQTAAQKQAQVAWWGHGVLWAVGLAIIGGGGYALQENVGTLQESEERYRSLIRTVRTAIVVHDAGGRIVTANPAAQHILGLSAAQIAGRPVRDAVWHFLQEDGSQLPVDAYPVQQVLATGQPVRDQVVGVPDREGGETVWALVNADPVFDEEDGIAQVIVTFMDITARKRAERVTEARLRIAAASTSKSSQALMQMTLDEVEALTGSEIGFYHTLLDDQETLVLQAWSTHTEESMCEATDHGRHYPVSEAGVWVDCIRERRPVIHNDYAALPHRKGMPPGHAPVVRELVFPVMRGEDVVAIIGVGNKPDDYDPVDIEVVSLLGDFSWEIIERKRVEEALARSEERYALALRAAEAGSWDWDIRTDALHWSEQIEPLFGFERGAFAGTFEAFLECVHPDDRQVLLDAVAACLDDDEDYAIEHRIIWPDGTVHWVSETGDVVRDDTGAPVRMLGVVQDITSRKRAEQEVVRQRDMLATTLESLTHPFFVLNAEDYTIEMANSASMSDEVLSPGLTCYGLTHKGDRPCGSVEHPCPLETVKASGKPAQVEHVHYAVDGSPRYVEVHGYPIIDESGRVVRMIEYTLDVTERRKAQKDLAEKTAALARSNAELEEFAYIASHDLQEPLRKVQAFGDRLQSRYGDRLDARGRDYLGRMQNAASRMRALIDDLLTYSRVTTKANPFEPVDLNVVADGVVADLVVRIEETGGGVDVGPLPTVHADRVQMRRLLQNLIGNALKFHREDEPPMVRVYAEMLDAEDDPVFEDAGSEGACRIFVADNGIGFDMAYVKQVFAPFQRLHGRVEYEGTGMGLAICRKIVARHGGDITAQSEPGQGTTFIINLPLNQK